MKISIHQPGLFPWIGLLDKIAKSEAYIILDDVPANKSAYQYRNQFFCNGEAKVISLPADYKLGKKINELRFKNDSWKADHLNKFSSYYQKSPFFDEVFPSIESLYNEFDGEYVVDFLIRSMNFCFKFLDIKTDVQLGSGLNTQGAKGDKVMELCKATKATTYLSGKGAMAYMDEELINEFERNHIGLEWHGFKHPAYNQVKHMPFVEGLASIDLFLFEGKEMSQQIFWNNVNSN